MCVYIYVATGFHVNICSYILVYMKTIAIIGRKGGTGKTTLSLNLAVAATLSGKSVAVFDLDQQMTASDWLETRHSNAPAVVPVFPKQVPKLLKQASDSGADLVLIDTPAALEEPSQVAVDNADLVLITAKSGLADLRAIERTVNIAKGSKRPAVIVFNGGPPNAKTRTENAIEAVSFYELPVAPIRIATRVAFEDAYNSSQGVMEFAPESKASEEIKQLYMFICEHIDM